jgi:selenocysteine lyase/cysteine desulfurase
MGALYGRRELLESLAAYKVRPADNALPSKFETGTQNHEAMAGLVGTFGYLEWLGRTYGDGVYSGYRSPRAGVLHAAMRAAHAHEDELKQRMLEGLLALPAARIYGITDKGQWAERVPTFAIRMGDEHPLATAQKLAERGICVWAGNYYALNLTERLGVESSGGMLRIGAAHYNTNEEVDYLLDCLR